MADIVDIFNSKLTELIADVCRVSPACADLKLAASLAIMGDRMAAMRAFVEHGDQYDEQVLARDDSVFMSDKFELPKSTATAALGSRFDVVQRLKGVWSSFTADEKDIVWTYLRVLAVLKQKFKMTTSVAR